MENKECYCRKEGEWDKDGRVFMNDREGLYGSDSKCYIAEEGKYKGQRYLNINDEFFVLVNYCPFCGKK